MERRLLTILVPNWCKSLLFFMCFIWLGLPLVAQESIEQPKDSVKTGVSLGKILMDNPKSIVSKYEYDPKIDRYVYTENIGEFNVNYPLFLTPDQYFDLIQKESIKSYFKEKIDAFSGKKEGSEEARKNLLPNFYINNGFFKTIFGGNSIEVIPPRTTGHYLVKRSALCSHGWWHLLHCN